MIVVYNQHPSWLHWLCINNIISFNKVCCLLNRERNICVQNMVRMSSKKAKYPVIYLLSKAYVADI